MSGLREEERRRCRRPLLVLPPLAAARSASIGSSKEHFRAESLLFSRKRGSLFLRDCVNEWLWRLRLLGLDCTLALWGSSALDSLQELARVASSRDVLTLESLLLREITSPKREPCLVVSRPPKCRRSASLMLTRLKLVVLGVSWSPSSPLSNSQDLSLSSLSIAQDPPLSFPKYLSKTFILNECSLTL